jgi:hypothetical protein
VFPTTPDFGIQIVVASNHRTSLQPDCTDMILEPEEQTIIISQPSTRHNAAYSLPRIAHDNFGHPSLQPEDT